MLRPSCVWKTGLASVTWAALALWSCSSSDSHIAKQNDATAGGQGGEAGLGAAGDDTSSGGSKNTSGSRNTGNASGAAGASGAATEAEGGATTSATAGGAAPSSAAGASELGGAGGQSDVCVPAAAGGDAAETQNGPSRVLYSNDFEMPNLALAANCGNSLDATGINALFGSQGFVFQEVNTVEGVLVHDPSALYSDPSGIGKNYALGMLSTYQNDLLALTFDVTGHAFLNVGFDLSAIDVSGCGGPFGTDAPVMQVRLYDTPSGTFSFGAPGTLLAQGDVTGVASPNQWTFAWKYGVVSLDATAVSGSSLTVVFDLLESGYAAFDNVSIVAADSAGVVDKNNDGIPDDQQCLP